MQNMSRSCPFACIRLVTLGNTHAKELHTDVTDVHRHFGLGLPIYFVILAQDVSIHTREHVNVPCACVRACVRAAVCVHDSALE